MAVNEQWTLGGVALNDTTNYILEAVADPPPAPRASWVTGTDSDGAVLGRDPLYENREITFRVRVAQQATMDLALAKIAAIGDLVQEAEKQPNGLALVWTPADATKTATAYVLSGQVEDVPKSWAGDEAGWFARAPVFTLRLTCRPFLYGAATLGSSTSSALPLMTVELTGVAGDVPAEGRLILTDNATQARRHVEWGLESRYYPTSSPPSLIVDSDSMVSGTANGFVGGGTVRTGAYDPNGTGSSVIRGEVTQQISAVCGLGNLTHVGVFRVKARVYCSFPSLVRLSWSENSGPLRANPQVPIENVNTFVEVDLGTVVLPEKIAGTQQWTGRIEAAALPPTLSTAVDVDAVWLVPAGEGYGIARAAYTYTPGAVLSSDDFLGHTAGAVLNGRSASAGFVWATSGSTTDFVGANASGAYWETRSTTSDSGTGRFAILGSTNYTDQEVRVDLSHTVAVTLLRQGAVARWTDASNHLLVYVEVTSGGAPYFQIDKVQAGGVAILAQKILSGFTFTQPTTVQVVVYASGQVYASLARGGGIIAELTAVDTALATGGALQTGKPGFFDDNGSASASTRLYDNFAMGVPTPEPIVMNSAQSLEVRSATTIREDSTGTYWGPPPSYRGSRFLVPPAGSAARKARIAVKARRNDVAVAPDTSIADSLTVQVETTPRFLVVPR